MMILAPPYGARKLDAEVDSHSYKDSCFYPLGLEHGRDHPASGHGQANFAVMHNTALFQMMW
jgi:hypothetical protein